ncbi:hypothetical protein C8Q78DRAFT_552464 [Trametes maxima]|nr:hypothetical protein C8Q78DRAFT_552464 [Trametes maxima]
MAQEKEGRTAKRLMRFGALIESHELGSWNDPLSAPSGFGRKGSLGHRGRKSTSEPYRSRDGKTEPVQVGTSAGDRKPGVPKSDATRVLPETLSDLQSSVTRPTSRKRSRPGSEWSPMNTPSDTPTAMHAGEAEASGSSLSESEAYGLRMIREFVARFEEDSESDREELNADCESSGAKAIVTEPLSLQSKPRPSTTTQSLARVVLTKIDQLANRIQELERRDVERTRELEVIKEAVNVFSLERRLAAKSESLGARLQLAEQEIRRLNHELGFLQGGEETQKELYRLCEDNY